MMTKTPHEILGVSENASMDEVKKAYRKKARENHPDLNPDDPAAAKRMNEVNEAYDRIMNPEKYTRQQAREAGRNPYAGSPYAGYGAGGSHAGGGQGYRGSNTGWDDTRGTQGEDPFGWGFGFDDMFGGGWGSVGSTTINPEASATDSPEVRQAIGEINTGRYIQAVTTLSNIPSLGRNGRWHYLSALANHGAGNSLSALEHIQRARRMEPENRDYQHAQQVFQQAGQVYQQESQERGFNMGTISPTTICCGLCLAQYFCRFFGLGF